MADVSRGGLLRFVAPCALAVGLASSAALAQPGNTRNIMLTGYWPPTNDMLREFSNSPDQNPGGWIGFNWEGRGYNVYSFFPEFPGQTCCSWGAGAGDFMVDYQDTNADWFPLVESVRPVAIVTFSRAGNDWEWEFEGGNGNYVATSWSSDYIDPRKPDNSFPILSSPDAPAPGTFLFSSHPIDQMRADLAVEMADVPQFFTSNPAQDNGAFLSNFIGLHGNWYKELNDDPSSPHRCFAGGHIHVGYAMTDEVAVRATKQTVRSLIDYLDTVVPPVCPGDVDLSGVVDLNDYFEFLGRFFAQLNGPPTISTSADIDGSGTVDLNDYFEFLGQFFASFAGGC